MTEACVYQTIHTLDGRPLHLAEHAETLDRASRALFGRPFRAEATLRQQIAALLASEGLRTDRSVFVRMILTADGELHPKFTGTSLYRGYALRSLSPDAASLRYDLPFGDYPTSARDALAALAFAQAEQRHARSVVRCNTEGVALTGDDAPLFAVRGTEVFTSPAIPCVERSIAAGCIAAAGLHLSVRPVMQDELPRFDELFYFDHRGVTALARCDGQPYMSLMSERVARAAEALTFGF